MDAPAETAVRHWESRESFLSGIWLNVVGASYRFHQPRRLPRSTADTLPLEGDKITQVTPKVTRTRVAVRDGQGVPLPLSLVLVTILVGMRKVQGQAKRYSLEPNTCPRAVID